MKFETINRRFTEIVTEWMSNGYTINTATMGGSQGEIGKIDLTDGKEVIRVLLDSFHKPCTRIEDRFYGFEGLELIVGRVTDPIQPNSEDTWNHIWNNRLEVISSEEFYQIGRGNRSGGKWYGTKAEAMAQQDKNSDRRAARRIEETREFPEAVKEIVLPFIRRQPRSKSVKLSEITKVTKTVRYTGFGEIIVKYSAEARGQSYRLN